MSLDAYLPLSDLVNTGLVGFEKIYDEVIDEHLLLCRLEGYAGTREVSLLPYDDQPDQIHFTYGSAAPFRQFLKVFCIDHSIPFEEF